MTVSEFKQAESQLLSDPHFSQLEKQLQRPNIFNILNLGNYEIRHSNFLAWLLNPNETHQAGDFFLRHFLADLKEENEDGLTQTKINALNRTQVNIKREWQNIDLLIITPNFVVCVENKMWSKEHSNQLQRYKDIIERYFPLHKKRYVFLSPYGKKSSLKNVYVSYAYKRIREIIEVLLKAKGHELDTAVQNHLKDYQRLIEQNIMGIDKEADQLAKALYKKHHQLFDFVSQNSGDALQELENKIIQQLLQPKEEVCAEKTTAPYALGSKSPGYVRFLPTELADLIATYPEAGGWHLKEAFLFEFEIKPYANSIRFKATSFRPKENQAYLAYDQKLQEILNPTKEPTNDWYVYTWQDFFWDLEFNHRTWDEETTDNKLKEILDAAKLQVQEITTKLLKHKVDLVTLKQEIENA